MSVFQHQLTPWKDGRIWALTFVTCCFEGTTFLVMYFWPSVLKNAHVAILAKRHLDNRDALPYGVIFATFMAAMILGVLLFNAFSGRGISPVWLLLAGVMLANFSLFLLAILGAEVALFAAFLLFEVANGLYVPSMAYLRGLIVNERSRTGVYGLMRIPLFLFVILALGITAEGKWCNNGRYTEPPLIGYRESIQARGVRFCVYMPATCGHFVVD